MDDYPHLPDDERSALEFLDAAGVGTMRRQMDLLDRVLDAGDRMLAQQGTLIALRREAAGEAAAPNPPVTT